MSLFFIPLNYCSITEKLVSLICQICKMNRSQKLWLILCLVFCISPWRGMGQVQALKIDLYGHSLVVPKASQSAAILAVVPTTVSLQAALMHLEEADYGALIDSLLAYRNTYGLNDWLYYQLIRKTAQELSPKETNYLRYTLYKWFLLSKSGYDARLALAKDKVIFYVFNNEDIADIPFFMVEGKKYMCLNYHDYAQANLNDDPPRPVRLTVAGAVNSFSYKVTSMPDFKPADYTDKKLAFIYDHKQYHFSIRLNKEVQQLFVNYPGVDFESYFNIPLSKETYSSLIPVLKNITHKMDQKKGVDYLMRFTRYAFLYENDQDNFGKEKRMSPEQTLFSAYSDCDDRAALFFYLVKEVYNLPMIALLYPTHITMAVQFSKPVGEPIWYKGKIYSVCEPTPAKEDLPIGRLAANLKNVPYEIVYYYTP